MNQIESDGLDMEVPDGYGKTRMFRKSFGTSFRGKVNPWKFTWEGGCRVPLLHSRGSVKARGAYAQSCMITLNVPPKSFFRACVDGRRNLRPIAAPAAGPNRTDAGGPAQ